MTILFVAAALAAAQAAPAAVDHSQHNAQQHAQHQGMDHSKHAEGKHDCKECCKTMKQQDGTMKCMDDMGKADPAAPTAPEHQGHSH